MTRRTRGVDDLDQIILTDGGPLGRRRRCARYQCCEILNRNNRYRIIPESANLIAAGNHQPRLHHDGDVASELRTPSHVKWDGDDALKEAPEEGRNPPRPVRRPDEDAFPSANSTLPQQIGERLRVSAEIGVRPDHTFGLISVHQRRLICVFTANPLKHID